MDAIKQQLSEPRTEFREMCADSKDSYGFHKTIFNQNYSNKYKSFMKPSPATSLINTE
jgi:hypothetical protein